MSKFNVGDKVKLISMYPDGDNEAFDGDVFEDRTLVVGEVYEIAYISKWGAWPIDLMDTGWSVSEDMLELVGDESEEEASEKIFESGTLIIAKTSQEPYFREGDIGVVQYFDGADYRVDFKGFEGQYVYNNGRWFINPSECAKYEKPVNSVAEPSPEKPSEDVVTTALAPTPLDVQEGGSHYKSCGIQPVEYIHANKLDYFQGNVVKYITRHKDKNGAQDIRKAIHYLQLILQLQYGE